MESNSEIQRLVGEFLGRRYMLDMGKGKLAKYLKSDIESVLIAKKLAKKTISYGYINPVTKSKLPKILIFDIETSPMISYHFGMWNINVSLDQVIENPIMLTWSAKWLFSPDVLCDRLTVDEVIDRDDSRISMSIWKLMNEADIIVAHYGDKFDIPTLNVRFLINGLDPVSTVTSIDTKAIASKNFRFPSNKLDALAIYFGFSKKLHTDFMLWRRCMEGSDDALAEMLTYNKRDVTLLEEVYLRLRPFAKGHPNVGLYLEATEPVCSHCGSSELHYESQYYTQTAKYDVYRCSCGALSRVRSSSVPKEVRKTLMVSTGK